MMHKQCTHHASRGCAWFSQGDGKQSSQRNNSERFHDGFLCETSLKGSLLVFSRFERGGQALFIFQSRGTIRGRDDQYGISGVGID